MLETDLEYMEKSHKELNSLVFEFLKIIRIEVYQNDKSSNLRR